MLNLFAPVNTYLRKLDTVRIDNGISRMHYKGTVTILIVFTIIITSRQYIGDPIDCIFDKSTTQVGDSYCWIYSTFTITNRFKGIVGTHQIQPGVSTYVEGEDTVQYHTYYQWVCFVLFFQAVLFYIPRYIWKMWEGRRLKSLVGELNMPIVPDSTKMNHKQLLIDYFLRNFHRQDVYVIHYFICETLYFVNVVGQIFFINLFLDNQFLNYWTDLIKIEPGNGIDPMARVFPKMTKCTFYKYGPSGSIENLDGLCVLPLNIVNEKIYVFLWFWFLILSVLTGLTLIWHSAVIMSSSFRQVLLCGITKFSRAKHIRRIEKMCQIGDWFVLYQLGRNIDPVIFEELINDLAQELQTKALA